MTSKKRLLINIYDFLFAILALISIFTVLAGFLTKTISLSDPRVIKFLDSILAIFALDYALRFGFAKNKINFLVQNSFDLLGLVPLHPIFAIFRIARVIRIIRSHHLLWRLGLDGRFSSEVHRFIYDTGFLNLFTVSIVILAFSALMYSIVERIPLSSALWWAITTATTVGYGDISPKTPIGKIIAAFLMFGGIGFIGLLTSTITGFFTSATSDIQEADMSTLIRKIDELNEKVDRLEKQTTDKRTQRKRMK